MRSLGIRQHFLLTYNSNCAKGRVLVQTCGRMGVHSLWSGSISDSEYMTKSFILKEQMEFALNDMVNGIMIAFTNVMDKGYRITMDCQEAGNQKTLQPDFMRSDKQFRAVESLSSATVASDRSGNERCVRLSKQSGFVRRGKSGNGSLTRLDNAWLGWGFMCNFVFESTH